MIQTLSGEHGSCGGGLLQVFGRAYHLDEQMLLCLRLRLLCNTLSGCISHAAVRYSLRYCRSMTGVAGMAGIVAIN